MEVIPNEESRKKGFFFAIKTGICDFWFQKVFMKFEDHKFWVLFLV